MTDILEKNLAKAIDRRIAVFKAHIASGNILQDETQLRAIAYLISEIVQPCCCMMCNKDKLKRMLALIDTIPKNSELLEQITVLVYNDLARCNGLG